MKNFTFKIFFFVLSLGLFSQAQSAGNCTAMLNNLMAFAQTKPEQCAVPNKMIEMTMTTNINTESFASYTIARLYHQPGSFNPFPFPIFFPENLRGNTNTLYSNRKWSGRLEGTNDCPIGLGCNVFMAPFYPFNNNNLSVIITKNPADATLANVNVQGVNIKARCDSGHIYGFGTGRLGTQLYDLTFKKVNITPVCVPS
ncbi:MAG: hypothetical protein ABL933_11575 [Methyloglobulus sp.]|nr:hypothetical protein [Methyloglobulus sp.]